MLFHMATHGYCTNLPALGTFSILTLTLLQKAVWRPSSPSQVAAVVFGGAGCWHVDELRQGQATQGLCQLPMAI